MNITASIVSILLLFVGTGLCGNTGETDRQSAGHLKREIKKIVEVKYLLYFPPGYDDSSNDWPLLLFLHGAGERGEDLERAKIHGPASMISRGEDFPFVVVTPLCPRGQWWDVEVLNTLLDAVIEQHKIDENRIYVTGLSMGGFGTWRMAYTYPDRFAAAIPICGGGDPQMAQLMSHIPTWVFHGAMDRTIPLRKSEEMVKALEAAGGEVKFTVYPDAGHPGAWKNAYADPELWAWLVKQRRNR